MLVLNIIEKKCELRAPSWPGLPSKIVRKYLLFRCNRKMTPRSNTNSLSPTKIAQHISDKNTYCTPPHTNTHID